MGDVQTHAVRPLFRVEGQDQVNMAPNIRRSGRCAKAPQSARANCFRKRTQMMEASGKAVPERLQLVRVRLASVRSEARKAGLQTCNAVLIHGRPKLISGHVRSHAITGPNVWVTTRRFGARRE
ncbi:hypothetical protein [Novosphingobium sp. PhB165]|uniref:hypothetical protein n=1 Tax=Novosphingobium sp. PhB165 TaxID=2485105 RepID=UPI001404DC2A|nr:hypothetical protein [Novosphingobium sp. PhB165]